MEQGQDFETVAVDIAFGEGDENRVQRAFFQQMQQHFVRPHRQIHFQIRTAQLHAHNQARNGFHG